MTSQNANTPGPARSNHNDVNHAPRRAKSTGLIITAVGVVLFNVAPFLKWVAPEDSDARSGYETDSLVPFIAYLGLGLLVAMVYAAKRAHRGQHRGLTLVSMAVGLAAVLQCLAFAIEPMGGLERGDDLSVESGVWVALISALIWTIGSALLAKEVEGDDHDGTDNHTRDANTGR